MIIVTSNNSAYSGQYSHAWEQVKTEVKHFDDKTDVVSKSNAAQEVLKTLKKYEKKPTELVGDEAQVMYIHETVHHLIAALNAFQDDLKDLKGDDLKKAKKSMDDIKLSLDVLTTLEATHNIVVHDHIKIIHHDEDQSMNNNGPNNDKSNGIVNDTEPKK